MSSLPASESREPSSTDSLASELVGTAVGAVRAVRDVDRQLGVTPAIASVARDVAHTAAEMNREYHLMERAGAAAVAVGRTVVAGVQKAKEVCNRFFEFPTN